jgi:predicted aminopeptidase
MRRWVFVALAGAAVTAGTLLSGCGSLAYYAQSVEGHFGIVRSTRPVDAWIKDEATPQPLRERLLLSQRIRDYAVHELKLPDNGSYRSYADLRRPAAVWNVAAAPELSLKPKTWCFLVVGCVAYRGYFDRARAEEMAAQLRAEGLEVSVYGVPAYSTLGWFDDPLLSTFIRYPDGELARMVFHELAHQVAHASGDTMFNESFATAVERIGSTRWMATQAAPAAAADYARFDARRRDFRALTQRYRDALEALYRSADSDDVKRQRKAELYARMRVDYALLKAGPWEGFAGYDAWFERANNASMAVLAAYNELVPQFERLFEREAGDFTRFYGEVKRIAALPKDERRATLAH